MVLPSLKALLFIADGMADRPIKELGWKTPLSAAKKPALDKLAKIGVCGIVDPISPGIPPGSDASTLALLGYDALNVYSGRGALEAIGSGVKVLPGDVAFRCNFATVNKGFVVVDRRAGRISNEDAAKLAESLRKVKLKYSDDMEFFFKNTVQHRGALVIRGPRLSTCVSDTDPEVVGKRVLEMKPLDKSREARHTATIVNDILAEFHRVLDAHPINVERVSKKLLPANMILCRGAGTIPNISPLSEVFGVKSSCVAAVSLIRGVCKAAGASVLDVKGATGTPQTDYMAKARAAVQALKACDFVFLHVKATDVAGHDGDVDLKVKVIERIDGMMSYILDKAEMDMTYVALTADHTTSSLTCNHEGDPVPLAIAGPYVRCDAVSCFDEISCAEGGLGRIRGRDVMYTLMGLLGKTKKFGA